MIEPWIAFNHLKQWLTVFFIPTLEQGFAQLIERMQQFYCPVIHDLLLRHILFNSAYMMEEGYAWVLPSKRHFAVGKESGLTNQIEWLNNTLHQRLSHLVRQSLSFSKKLDNHIGAIWNFIHYYNQKIREKLQRERVASFPLSFT